MDNNIRMTDTLVGQILAIRKSGKYNMFDTISVQREAYEREYYELLLFLQEHQDAYSRFILTGER